MKGVVNLIRCKKVSLLLIVIALAFSIGACSSEKEEVVSQEAPAEKPSESIVTNEGESSELNTSIEVDENLLTVDVTLPASFFQDSTEEEIMADADGNGYIATKINDDGSVTYTMTKAKRNEILKEMKSSIDESIDELLNGEEKVGSFLKIEYNDKLTIVDIYVDPALYSDWDSFHAIGFYLMGGFYQNFDGVPSEEIDVVVNFINNDTKEVINSGSLKEMGN